MSNLDPKELSTNQDLQDWIEALENLNLFDGTEHTKKIVNDFVNPNNIIKIMREADTLNNLDIFSLDIDGIDYCYMFY